MQLVIVRHQPFIAPLPFAIYLLQPLMFRVGCSFIRTKGVLFHPVCLLFEYRPAYFIMNEHRDTTNT